MWDESKFLEDKLTPLTEAEAAQALYSAYKEIHGEYPSNKTLAILLAHTGLEVGRWKQIHWNNWGNVKSRPNDGHFYTMYRCSEIINGKEIWFDPPHDQTKFRAFKTTKEGVVDYIDFLTGRRYIKALACLKDGDIVAYTLALKEGGYFTAGINVYLKLMVKLFNEFIKKVPNFDLKEEVFESEPENKPELESIAPVTKTIIPSKEVEQEIIELPEVDVLAEPPEDLSKSLSNKSSSGIIIAILLAIITFLLSIVDKC